MTGRRERLEEEEGGSGDVDGGGSGNVDGGGGGGKRGARETTGVLRCQAGGRGWRRRRRVGAAT